jgi:hypothetical protein
MSANVPCGRNQGHGEWCVIKRLCPYCTEILELRMWKERLIMLLAELEDELIPTVNGDLDQPGDG